MLISRKPFTAADIDRARARSWPPPDMQADLPAGRAHSTTSSTDLLRSPDPADYERNYTFDITPVSDNRPFFFYTVQPRDLWRS